MGLSPSSNLIENDTYQDPTKRARVAVVGAGGAGLVAGKCLRDAGLQVKIIEATDDVGGLWKYRETSPIYKSLVTNLPKEIMQFLDFPFREELPSFVTHKDMYDYLQEYTQKFQLAPLLSLNTRVTGISQFPDTKSLIFPETPCWEVVSQMQHAGKEERELFDAVVICNGHYSKPFSPQLPGLENFSGRIMHSMTYDSPDEFQNERVLCIGARASGTDIAREVSQVAMEVHVIDKDCSSREVGGEKGNISRWPLLQCFLENNMVEFITGEKIGIDTVIFCTGYDYCFPFLPKNFVETDERRVHPLYHHVFHAVNPSISFVGIPHSVVPFPLFEFQSKWIASIYGGKSQLPSSEEMLCWLQEHYCTLKRMRDAHHMSSYQWEYCRKLAELSGDLSQEMIGILAVNKQVYDDVSVHRPLFPGGAAGYRNRQYKVDKKLQTWTVQG